MDALWDDAAVGLNAVQVHVSRLRRLVGPGRWKSTPGGYRMPPTPSPSTPPCSGAPPPGRMRSPPPASGWAANRSHPVALALWQGRRRRPRRPRVSRPRGRWTASGWPPRAAGSAATRSATTSRWSTRSGPCSSRSRTTRLVALLMVALLPGRSGRRRPRGLPRRASPARRRPRRRAGSTWRPASRVLARPGAGPRPAAAVLAVPTGCAVAWSAALPSRGSTVGGDAGPITLVGPPASGSHASRPRPGGCRPSCRTGSRSSTASSRRRLDRARPACATQLGLDLFEDRQALRAARGLLVLDGSSRSTEHAALVDLVDSLSMPVVATAHRPCGWRTSRWCWCRPLETESPDGEPSPARRLLLLRGGGRRAHGRRRRAPRTRPRAPGCSTAYPSRSSSPLRARWLRRAAADLERERERHRAGLGCRSPRRCTAGTTNGCRRLHVLARSGGPVDTAWLRTGAGSSSPTGCSTRCRAGPRRPGPRGDGAQDRAMFELLDGVRAEVLAGGSDDDRRGCGRSSPPTTAASDRSASC